MRRICVRNGRYSEIAKLKVFRDRDSGIERCAAAITEGEAIPGLGGTRQSRWPNDADMVEDVVLLAQGMHHKAAFHGLPFCGGKVCVQLTAHANVRRAFESVGRLVKSFDGALITTEDMGTDPEKMEFMHVTAEACVLGRPVAAGGSGDPSPYTAVGVVESIRAVANRVMQRSDLSGLRVYVKGVGNVGGRIARLLARENVTVLADDADPERLSEYIDDPLIEVVSNREDPGTVDVFCPCACGGDVHWGFDLPGLRAVVGAANNQLFSDDVAIDLHNRSVTYVPDWVANGGGLISVAAEQLGRPRSWATRRATEIGARVEELLVEAMARGLPPLDLAYELSEQGYSRSLCV